MKKYLLSFLILLFLTGCNVQNSHSHTKCEDCGKCIAGDCDGIEEDKCTCHQIILEHIECQECGKCIAEDCNGLDEEKCNGCVKMHLTDKTYVSHLDLEIDFPNVYIINTY